MKTVTITLDEDLVRRARIAATAEGQSLSRFIRETVERQVDRPITQSEAIERFLAGPPLRLLDENGRAPTRDQRNARAIAARSGRTRRLIAVQRSIRGKPIAMPAQPQIR